MKIDFGLRLTGKISKFGGALDRGLLPGEGLALYNRHEENPDLFLREQPDLLPIDRDYPGKTTGLARRLNTEKLYCAMFWDYEVTPKKVLRNAMVRILNPKNARMIYAIPVDKGPALWTGRLIDASDRVLMELQVDTDEIVECVLEAIKTV